jgi:UDP-glucose 4-epimerase
MRPRRPWSSDRRVLVTGAGGFIGSRLALQLAELGATVTGLARHPGRLSQSTAGVQFYACDLMDAERTQQVVLEARPHVVFHLAAHPDAREDARQLRACIDSNIAGTATLLEALRALPGVAVIFGDSAKVCGNAAVPHASASAIEPLSSYALSKVAGWALCDLYRRIHGLQVVCVRPTLDPLFIDDAVDAFIAAAENRQALDGRVIPIGGGRETTVLDLAKLTVQLLGGTQTPIARPTSIRPTEMLRSWCDNADARVALGWSPRVSLEEGIAATAAYFLAKREGVSAEIGA